MANLGRLAIAMLGVLAYQNRDKIAEMIRGAGERDANNPQGGILDQVSRGVAGTALGDILDRFKNAGAGPKVDSWVGTGPNEPHEVEKAIDAQTLEALSTQTGLSREELIARITRDLPDAVNQMTPNGKLPADHRTNDSVEPTLLDDVPRTGSGTPKQ
ncbi:YidB family protein [Mesorhizobium sp. CO1-1-11]|uniref:YidB family protein n=1 Tax=Mesorhizobium sp. CO1-1-11 TaxID=2876636 RepID=UPI001CCC5CC0|nr:YidB family protein [Mesorhizobium sp. CO1-1-11]MBZ9722944.1 YidB family protein [Mesorhizobium sp. CO1-1-11]